MVKNSNPNSGLYEIVVDPGEYLLSVSKPGYQEKEEAFTAFAGNNEYSIYVDKLIFEDNKN